VHIVSIFNSFEKNTSMSLTFAIPPESIIPLLYISSIVSGAEVSINSFIPSII